MAPVPGSLGPEQRSRDLERLSSEEFDVLVVGGGATGVGCALDAVTRGLSVALIEQRDLASGTSSRSSKLLHGGLRYLEQRDFELVREALRERSLHAGTIAPHLVRPVSFLLPLRRRLWHRLYYGAGVLLYDLLALGRKNPLPRHRHLSRRAALELMPGLKRSSLVGGILYYDAQVDDARHTLAVARTAARHGAAVVTSVRLDELVLEDGVVGGAVAIDVETGRSIEIRARQVVNATGVWLDQIHQHAGPSGLRVQAAKGVHIVVPRECIAGDTGVILRTPSSVLFIIPWGRHWLVGTTDTEYELDRAHPAASAADIDYILDQANQSLHRPLRREDIVGVYAGLRPLIAAGSGDTARLSREHAVDTPIPGLVSIAGGKYTTYRVMAADAIDVAAEGLGRPVAASITAEIELVGAHGWDQHIGRASEVANRLGVSTEIGERLLWRHGNQVDHLLEIAAERPDLTELLPGGDYLGVEVVFAARHEGAMHLEDVLARRMRLSIEDEERGLLAAEVAVHLMGDELGWATSRRGREVRSWRKRIAAERAANAAPDDVAADAARRAAIDARGLVEA